VSAVRRGRFRRQHASGDFASGTLTRYHPWGRRPRSSRLGESFQGKYSHYSLALAEFRNIVVARDRPGWMLELGRVASRPVRDGSCGIGLLASGQGVADGRTAVRRGDRRSGGRCGRSRCAHAARSTGVRRTHEQGANRPRGCRAWCDVRGNRPGVGVLGDDSPAYLACAWPADASARAASTRPRARRRREGRAGVAGKADNRTHRGGAHRPRGCGASCDAQANRRGVGVQCEKSAPHLARASPADGTEGPASRANLPRGGRAGVAGRADDPRGGTGPRREQAGDQRSGAAPRLPRASAASVGRVGYDLQPVRRGDGQWREEGVAGGHGLGAGAVRRVSKACGLIGGACGQRSTHSVMSATKHMPAGDRRSNSRSYYTKSSKQETSTTDAHRYTRTVHVAARTVGKALAIAAGCRS